MLSQPSEQCICSSCLVRTLDFGATGCMLDLTLILDGSAPTSLWLGSCLVPISVFFFFIFFIFRISKHPHVIFGEAAKLFFLHVSR